METKKYLITVVGSGISGLYTALRIAEEGFKVALITKTILGESNTRYAQGGVAVVLPENSKDSIDLHVKDTLIAGAGLSNPDVTRFISTKGAQVISNLINYGVEFDKSNDNKLAMTMEGAHSVRRVLHAGGDATGKTIEKTLVSRVANHPDIDSYEEYQAIELLTTKDSGCSGLVVFNTTEQKHLLFLSNITILATGGLSQVYRNTTNPHVATGDGVALAHRAGATIQDMEFIQFHPTAFHSFTTPRFLISESVRGEGAKLRNINGELFAHKYDERADLAPRDIVTRAIISEMNLTGSDHVFLDATSIPAEVQARRFPNIIQVCLANGIDIRKDYIPVSPAAHYSMGGIKVDVTGQTTIKNLFAVGETACSSLHGANRLASNSLLECVVLADEVANHVVRKSVNHDLEPLKIEDLKQNPQIDCIIQSYSKVISPSDNDIEELIIELQNTTWKYAGVIRNKSSLEMCIELIDKIRNDFNRDNTCANYREYELRNLIIIASLIAHSALLRKESRGAHYRNDHTETLENAYHSYVVNKKDEVCYEFASEQNCIKQICKQCS